MITGIGMTLAAAGGCGLGWDDVAFVGRDDVVLGLPAARAGVTRGEVHERVTRTASAIDGWIGGVVDEAAIAVAEVEGHRETRRDGRFALYGPFDDAQERDLAWLVKLDGDDRHGMFELWAGRRGATEADLALVLAGDVDTRDGQRRGQLELRFDAIDLLPALRPEADARFAGAVGVEFTRARSEGAADVALEFREFVREDDAGTTWRASDTFVYERDAAGGGAFHLALASADDLPIVGELGVDDVDRVELDLRWDAEPAGRARASVRAAANPDGALPHGDLLVHECFDAAGGLTWRELNGPYAAESPSYALGDAASCVFAAPDLDVP
ncbi:MAG TPA: hypothetical protein VFG69_15555 [Nannocystaceae bacterium]|nr:hypothetical protein [Nannocystaceae bacterium]